MAKENMTVAQLREVAAQKGVTIPSKATKADIVALLEAKPSKKKDGASKEETPKKVVNRYKGEH